MTMIQLKTLSSSNIKLNNLSEINNGILGQVIGGRLPNDDEWAFILALRNTELSRALVAAIMADKHIFINGVLFASGSSGNSVVQISI